LRPKRKTRYYFKVNSYFIDNNGLETYVAVQEYVAEFITEIQRIEEFYMKHVTELNEEFKNIEKQIEFKSYGESMKDYEAPLIKFVSPRH
jgi:inorganic pyrophosphatase